MQAVSKVSDAAVIARLQRRRQQWLSLRCVLRRTILTFLRACQRGLDVHFSFSKTPGDERLHSSFETAFDAMCERIEPLLSRTISHSDDADNNGESDADEDDDQIASRLSAAAADGDCNYIPNFVAELGDKAREAD